MRLDGGSIEGRPILELHALLQVEGPCEVVGADTPRLGQHRLDIAGAAHPHKGLVDLLIHCGRSRIDGVDRIQVGYVYIDRVHDSSTVCAGLRGIGDHGRRCD